MSQDSKIVPKKKKAMNWKESTEALSKVKLVSFTELICPHF